MNAKREKDELHKAIVSFEREYGSIAFLKATVSALNRVLVDKGIVTKRELVRYFKHELSLVKKSLDHLTAQKHQRATRHRPLPPVEKLRKSKLSCCQKPTKTKRSKHKA